MKARALLVVLAAALVFVACSSFSPQVGPLRDASPEPDCAPSDDPYTDAGACTGAS